MTSRSRRGQALLYSESSSPMRHNEDARCIASTGLFFVLFVTAWQSFTSPYSNGISSLLLWLALFQLSFMGAVTTHNAIHLPIFWNANLNKFYQICLSLQYGGAVTIFIPGHNLSHHKYPQQARDVSKYMFTILMNRQCPEDYSPEFWSRISRDCDPDLHTRGNADFAFCSTVRTTKVCYKWNLLNGLLFFWHVVLSGNKDDKLYFAAQARLSRPIVKQRCLEEVAVWCTTAILISLDWRRWFWFALLLQFYAKYCILSLNFLQHDGCDMSSKFNFARNFTGQTLNYLCFNNGYHTIHHLYPGLHWTLLSKKHKELVAPHIAPKLENSNILLYMWRSFIYPGVRLDYQGRPLLITKEENMTLDEPWFYSNAETYSGTEEQPTLGSTSCT